MGVYPDPRGSLGVASRGVFTGQMAMAQTSAEQSSVAAGGNASARRDEAAFLEAKRHSTRVRAVKLALPVIAAALAAGFFAYSYALSPTGLAIDVEATAIRDGKLVMANPKVSGYTDENLPYTMTAIRAIQDLSQSGLIELEEIDATFPVSGGNEATVRAATGKFDEAGNTLDITSPVTFKTSDGMTANLESAFINIDAGELSTEKPVDIVQTGSRITADSFQVLEKGKVFVFEKRVRVTIEPNQTSGEPGTAAGD